MKKLYQFIICIALFFILNTAYSQEFAPVGATWYFGYEQQYMNPLKLNTLKSVGTTEILGKECKILKTYITYYDDMYGEIHTYNAATDYYYKEAGKIYHYDQFADDFEVFYDFNLTIGANITVRDTTFPDCWNHYPEDYYCSNFKYVVEGSDSITVDGYNLKVVYASPHPEATWMYQWFETATLIENIGSLQYWYGVSNVIWPELQFPYLRCYEDTNMFYRSEAWPEPFPCDSLDGLITSINEKANNYSHLLLFPNPANDHINITLGELLKGDRIAIYNDKGQIVKKAMLQSNKREYEFTVSGLPAGLYVAVLFDEGKVVDKKKVVVSH